jgi:hypothetical protein
MYETLEEFGKKTVYISIFSSSRFLLFAVTVVRIPVFERGETTTSIYYYDHESIYSIIYVRNTNIVINISTSDFGSYYTSNLSQLSPFISR